MSTYQLTYSLPIFFNFSLPELPVKSSQWSPSYMVSKCQIDSFADILSQSKKQTQFYCRLSDHNEKIQPKHGWQDTKFETCWERLF